MENKESEKNSDYLLLQADADLDEKQSSGAKRPKRSPLLIALLALLVITSVTLSYLLANRIIFSTVSIGLILILILWGVPKLQVGRWSDQLEAKDVVSLENNARAVLAQIIGGLILLIGLYFTAMNLKIAQKSADTTSKGTLEGQITERFTKAVAQLGENKKQINIGGIYALERLARDYSKSTGDLSEDVFDRDENAPTDYWAIMEILTAYVRVNSSWRQELGNKAITRLADDVQAVVNVLKRRDGSYFQKESAKFREPDRLNLNETNLRRANLEGAPLEGVNFKEAHLEEALIANARLDQAIVAESYLQRSWGNQIHLEGANLYKTRLDLANLPGAHLNNANLESVVLDGAYLIGADLAGIQNWHKITSLTLANIYGVKNAPDGFREWARAHGAVEQPDLEMYQRQIDAAVKANRIGKLQ